MSEKDLREKYGGKLPKAINRAIRAEIPGGNEALDTLTRLAGPAMQSKWVNHAGAPTAEAKSYFTHLRNVIIPMENKIRRDWDIKPGSSFDVPKSARPSKPKTGFRGKAGGFKSSEFKSSGGSKKSFDKRGGESRGFGGRGDRSKSGGEFRGRRPKSW